MRVLAALALALAAPFGNVSTALADEGSSSSSSSGSFANVTEVELFEYGTWNTSAQIDDAGSTIDLYIQLTFDNSDYLTWAQWDDKSGDYAGSYYAYSSDESVATVSTQDPLYGQMTVTAVGEGTAEIYVVYTPYDGGEDDKITSTVFTVTVPDQDPEYVTDIAIMNDDGTAVGDDPIVFYETGEYMQLYVKLTWYNSETGETWTETTTEDSTELDSVTWESDATDFVYVNATTGRIAVLSNSSTVSARVTATSAAGKNGTEISDSIYITYDGQDSRSYVPAEDLTIIVEYEDMPDGYEPEEYTFTIDEVIENCGGLQYGAYTYFRQNGSYSTHFVQGVKLYEVIEMVQTDIDDIASFRFSSQINDGYEVPISYTAMYDTTHYFCTEPEVAYSLSGSQWKQYATATTPLLAISAYTAQGDSFNDYMSGGDVDWDSVPLDEAQLFRLEIGCTGPSDTSALSKSVYNVDTIVIVLDGAPPATSGTDSGGYGNDSGSGGTGEGYGTGYGTGSGMGIGSGSGSGTGSGNGVGSGTGDSVAAGIGDGSGGSGSGSSTGAGTEAAGSGGGGDGGDDAEEGGGDGEEEGGSGSGYGGDATGGYGTGGSGNENVAGSKRWQVYQMMNDVDSVTDVYDVEDNPLEPYVMLAAILIVIAGGASMKIGFERRLR